VQVVDVNVLLYAINARAANHEPARRWLDDALAGRQTVGFAWMVMLAFLRLSSRQGVFEHPLSADIAARVLEDWLDQPAAVVVNPGDRHLHLVAGLLRASGAAGNLVNDAHLAALSVEHGAEIVSFDRDFGRFDGVSWRLPEAPNEPG
jgi:toxin-antitoxin system PIN domain toxin